MTARAKPRRHFIAWSPKRVRAFCAPTEGFVRLLAREYERGRDGMRHPTWRQITERWDWRVTEVSE